MHARTSYLMCLAAPRSCCRRFWWTTRRRIGQFVLLASVRGDRGRGRFRGIHGVVPGRALAHGAGGFRLGGGERGCLGRFPGVCTSCWDGQPFGMRMSTSSGVVLCRDLATFQLAGARLPDHSDCKLFCASFKLWNNLQTAPATKRLMFCRSIELNSMNRGNPPTSETD